MDSLPRRLLVHEVWSGEGGPQVLSLAHEAHAVVLRGVACNPCVGPGRTAGVVAPDVCAKGWPPGSVSDPAIRGAEAGAVHGGSSGYRGR